MPYMIYLFRMFKFQKVAWMLFFFSITILILFIFRTKMCVRIVLSFANVILFFFVCCTSKWVHMDSFYHWHFEWGWNPTCVLLYRVSTNLIRWKGRWYSRKGSRYIGNTRGITSSENSKMSCIRVIYNGIQLIYKSKNGNTDFRGRNGL